MKYLITLFSILLVLMLNSCNKIEKGALSLLEGDYDWVFTKHDDILYTTNTESIDQYGARINSKNKLLFFKNGIEVSRHKIVRYTPNANGSTSNLQIKTNEFGNIVYSSGDTLKVQTFPYKENSGLNYFIKKN